MGSTKCLYNKTLFLSFATFHLPFSTFSSLLISSLLPATQVKAPRLPILLKALSKQSRPSPLSSLPSPSPIHILEKGLVAWISGRRCGVQILESPRLQDRGFCANPRKARHTALGQRDMEMKRPHVVCIPFPTQGHINPMMQIAILLHKRGFLISFVNTDYSHQRLVRSGGLDSLEGLDGFRFMTISDGLSPSSGVVLEEPKVFLDAMKENCVAPFHKLLRELHHSPDGHRVTCIVSDSFMTFTLKVAEEVGIPEMIFCPMSACGFMAFAQYRELMRRGLIPLKDESYVNNVYLDTTIDWIPGMKGIRLRDLGSLVQSTDAEDFALKFVASEAQNTLKASVIIFNTFDDLEHQVLHAIRAVFPPRIYSIGPLSRQCHLTPDHGMKSVKSSLWKEERECLKWLGSFEAASVIYVNFGSTTVITEQQLMEFGWGIANSNYPFMWVIRPDILMGGHAKLPQDFLDEIEGRGMLVSWCPQEEVLAHPSISFFLTHCGWNSTLESLSFGVPMLCWPFFFDQQTNCYYACNEWGVGVEVGKNAQRDDISSFFKQLMEGEKGKEMREKALRWKECAELSINEGGSSHTNLELLIHELAQLKEN